MANYSKKTAEKIEQAMQERKKGTLRTGSGKKVTSRKQAIAIGLSGALEDGDKMPGKKKGSKKTEAKDGKKATTKNKKNGLAKKSLIALGSLITVAGIAYSARKVL